MAKKVQAQRQTRQATKGSDFLKDDLIASLTQRRAILVIGSGITLQATGRQSAASWKGLIESGIQHATALSSGKERTQWQTAMLQLLNASSPDGWLTIADEITRRLGGVRDGEWFAWLERTVGSLSVASLEILKSIRAIREKWHPIIMTTNYDDLLERELKVRAVTWRDLNSALDIVALRSDDILHIHGYWKEPESVVLGVRSYDQLLGNELAQSVQKAAAILNSFVFIGCGDGLDDPNVGLLLNWINETLKGARHRHYVLLRADRAEAFCPSGRLVAISYGEHYADLGPFLRSLVQEPESLGNSEILGRYSNAIATPSDVISREFLDEVADAITDVHEGLGIVQRADEFRAVLDPNRPPIRRGKLSLAGNSFEFWDSAFRQFELQSIRATAALLVALPTPRLSEFGRARREQILLKLYELSKVSSKRGESDEPSTRI